MMYPYIEFPDNTLVTHSHLKEENGVKVVNVHFERPKPYGFDSARISLPSYAWIMRDGYTDEELTKFESFAARHAHTLFYYAETGGVPFAEAI